MSTEQMLKEQIIQKAWEDESFKKSLLADPKSALKEAFDVDIPDEIEVIAVEETPSRYYLVIPQPPAEEKEAQVMAEMW
ncbi:NHLP leader peptide family RiPP precursor [Paenibacillus sp. NEAU-GSW1]|uniref:NHLP leader peptide family RiPP precursor n=1 Tax=Paenibacillus sp. NEAU-GSW1 TaxID=2682486 RepID=UPI0012E26E4B|nr:NHLP leader peptide family RiPP precursor [Paenibacillus sp. NEAU-GSW1]MUT68433.1 NHLP leader peptide family natural product precursor [Paenibacillus sp. NEAU-GSW1]